MKSAYTFSAVLCAILASIFGGALALADAPSLKIGTEGTWKPFSYYDSDGKLTGFEVELAQEVCAKAGITCEMVVLPFDSLIPALQEGKIDAVASGLRITEKRKKVVDFATPYYRLRQTFASCKHRNLANAEPATLKGMSVGVQVATASFDFLKARHAELDIRPYKSIDDILADLSSGRLDLAVTNLPTLHEFMTGDAGKGCVLVGEPFTDPEFFKEPTAIAVRKGDAATRATLDKGIAAVLSDGSFDAINARYWPFSIRDTAN